MEQGAHFEEPVFSREDAVRGLLAIAADQLAIVLNRAIAVQVEDDQRIRDLRRHHEGLLVQVIDQPPVMRETVTLRLVQN